MSAGDVLVEFVTDSVELEGCEYRPELSLPIGIGPAILLTLFDFAAVFRLFMFLLLIPLLVRPGALYLPVSVRSGGGDGGGDAGAPSDDSFFGGSGIGHMCIVMAQSGCIIVSHT